jgi:AcrR family transcriptional regulator
MAELMKTRTQKLRAKKSNQVLVDMTLIKLDTNLQPRQARAQDTYEVVLATAGHILTHLGFEQLTTNAICEQAGITPPALYRYFPNKYAILKALGERLMTAQDAIVFDWISQSGTVETTLESAISRLVTLQRQVIEVTTKFPGGVAVNRAIRAIPMLQKLHVDSREMVARQIFMTWRARYPKVPEARLQIATRMIAEFSSALTQMVVEEPDLESDFLIYEASYLFILYFQSFGSQPPKNQPYTRKTRGTHEDD